MDRERLPVPPLALARADRQARSLRAALDRVALALTGTARSFVAARGWIDFGYARLDDHARERFSRSGRWLRDLAALAGAVDRLPGLAAALSGADGGRPLGRVAALLIGRVASTESLRAWVDLARRSTVREFRQVVRRARAERSSLPSGCAAGNTPTEPAGKAGTGHDGEGAGDETGLARTGTDGHDEDAGDQARTQVRLPVPAAVRAAFDETLDLYRAVVGQQAPATSFVEDLVAEASSGPHPPDAEQRALLRVTPVARVEQALARSTGRWRHLDDEALAGLPGFGSSGRPGEDAPCSSPVVVEGPVSRVDDLLRRVDTLSHAPGGASARALDARIRELLRIEDELERELGEHLAAMGEAGAWLRLHFAGVGHYAEERLGLSRTQGQTRARVARRLHQRPVLRRAYESGALGLEAASLLLRLPVRSADPRRDAAWVARAGEVTVKRLRDECRAVRRDSAGGAPSSEGVLPARIVASPSPPTVTPLSDQAWFASLRRDRGTARRRLDEFARLALASPFSDEMLCLRLPAWLAGSFLSAVETARRAVASTRLSSSLRREGLALGSAGTAGTTEWALGATVSTRWSSTRGRPTPTWVGLLMLLGEFVATWDPSPGAASSRRPSEEEIYSRDGWRCAAPGCTSRRHLEDHHLVYRSRGGGNDADNRICLCRFHHQWGEHGRLARCRGRAPLGVDWVLGSEGVGGRFRNERVVVLSPTPMAGPGPRPGRGGAGCAL